MDFRFSPKVRMDAFLRQQQRCAICGRNLRNLAEEAHHVIPQQVAQEIVPPDPFFRSLDNCVALCISCHGRAHGDEKFAKGAVPPPSYYEFANGMLKEKQQQWLVVVEPKFHQAFDALQRTAKTT